MVLSRLEASRLSPAHAAPPRTASAERHSDAAAFRLLLAHGADLDVKDASGRTPLGAADALGAFRGTPPHSGRAGLARCRIERVCARIDARYSHQRPGI